ncbi:hypothetical protein [Salinisphaera sp. Q1T1-3]|uniref:hypothetical protein n=1 Tax=Salinisphaera sp. Q1T1-3 TaxID=2321229 RepID=UPI000E7327DA|nr:hypothetical protein [Salinisphaera sp. Q1T1-3]RJS95283.1 hypothetical protein D3260_01655 [Salinisphaera sp. Q1T1-3]
MAKRPENQVADYRANIERLKAERAEVVARPATPTEAEARIDAYLASQAEQYRRRVTVERLKLRADLDALGDKDDAFFAFYFRDQIKAALMAETADGMDAADRSAELERIDTALLEAEQAEESAITEAEQRGHYITRRADADPRAVLAFD